MTNTYSVKFYKNTDNDSTSIALVSITAHVSTLGPQMRQRNKEKAVELKQLLQKTKGILLEDV